MKKVILGIFMFLLLLTGCQAKEPMKVDTLTPKSTNRLSDLSVVEDVDDKEDPGVARAKRHMDEFIQLLQRENVQGLLDELYMNDSEAYYASLNYSSDEVSSFIKRLELDVDLDTIQAIFDSVNMMDNGYSFRLKGYKGDREVTLEEPFNLLYGEEEQPMYWSPYLRYLPYVDWMFSEYIKLIQEQDPENLSYFLTEDDLAYSVEKAQTIIEKYHSYFEDINSLQMVGLEAFKELLIDSQGHEHVVEIIGSDGLMAIRDSLVPSIYD